MQAGAAGGHHRSTRCTHSPPGGRTAQHQRQQLGHLQTVGADRRGRMARLPGGNQVHHQLLQRDQLPRDPHAGRRRRPARPHPDHLAATRCTTSDSSSISRSAIHLQTVGADRRGRMAWLPGGNQVHHELLQLGQLQRDPHAGHRGWCTPSVGLAPTGQLDHRHLKTTNTGQHARGAGPSGHTARHQRQQLGHLQTVGDDRRGRMAWLPGGKQVHHQLLQRDQPQHDPRAGRRGWWPPSVDQVHAHASSTIGTCRPPAAADRSAAAQSTCRPSAPASAAAWPDHLAATRCTTSCCRSASRSAIHAQAVGAGQRGRMARPPGGNQVHHQLLQIGQAQRDPRAGRRRRPARPHGPTTWRQPGAPRAAAARPAAARSTRRPPRLVHAIGRPGAHRPARPSAPADHQHRPACARCRA